MVKQANRWIALGTLGVMTASTFGGLGITAAHAGSKGRRNTAIALGALTVGALVKKKKKAAIVGGVATAWAYKRYSNEKKRERRRREARLHRRGRYGRYSR
ncbi:MAG: hypothetical protein M3347_17075 [Armatimonadota bacterium]|nr:hypothetical protein [Armatimonadota bacterium]